MDRVNVERATTIIANTVPADLSTWSVSIHLERNPVIMLISPDSTEVISKFGKEQFEVFVNNGGILTNHPLGVADTLLEAYDLLVAHRAAAAGLEGARRPAAAGETAGGRSRQSWYQPAPPPSVPSPPRCTKSASDGASEVDP